jgi:hypothetical protein
LINGIPLFSGNRPNISYDIPAESRSIIDLLMGGVDLSYMVGLPTLGDVIGKMLWYPARIKMTVEFRDGLLNKLFGDHEIEIPFPIILPEPDGKHHEEIKHYNISFLLPVWNVLSHVCNVKFSTGSGKGYVMLVQSVDDDDDYWKVNVPIVDYLLEIMNRAYKIFVKFVNIFGPMLNINLHKDHNDVDEVVDKHYDWYYNRHYEYEYYFNTV